MSINNPLHLNGEGTTTDRLTALENVVNILTNEMYEKRVKQAQEDIQAVSEKADNIDATHSITFVTLAEAGQIDEVTAGEHIEMFEAWNFPIAYNIGQLRQYNGILYKCILEHTSQEDWTPDTAVSLWTTTANPAEEWPLWSQPIGAHDAYMTGDKVTYNDQHYISTVDHNVWSPPTNWELVTE